MIYTNPFPFRAVRILLVSTSFGLFWANHKRKIGVFSFKDLGSPRLSPPKNILESEIPMATLDEKIAQLPPAARKEISDIIEYFHWKYGGTYTETIDKGEKAKLEKVLQNAKGKLLALEEDWDENGAKKIKEGTYKRVAEFLVDLQAKILQVGVSWTLPEIFPGTNGEILVQWKTDRFQLVILIPEDTTKPINYYATDYNKNEEEGTATNERLNNLYFNWARQLQWDHL